LPVEFVVLDDRSEPTWFPAAWRDKFWGRFHSDDREQWQDAHRVFAWAAAFVGRADGDRDSTG